MGFKEVHFFFTAGGSRRPPPAYSVAAQMARLHRLGRAHSHEGCHYHTDPDTDQGKTTSFLPYIAYFRDQSAQNFLLN